MSFPTSYIKTEGSQVTRVADSASITGENFSEWYRQDEGSYLIDAETPDLNGVVSLQDTQTDNFINSSFGSGGIGQRHLLARSNGDFVVILGADSTELGERSFLAAAYKRNDFAVVTNGGAVASDVSNNVPLLNKLRFGNGLSVIKRLTYYPKRLPNAVLQTLTEE